MEAVRAVATLYREARKVAGATAPIWREREALRRDLHRAVDVYFLKKLAGE